MPLPTCSDLRLGVGGQTVACDFEKAFRMHDRLYVGLSGLATDVQTMAASLEMRVAMYKLREERDIKPATFGHMLSAMLYEKRCGGAARGSSRL